MEVEAVCHNGRIGFLQVPTRPLAAKVAHNGPIIYKDNNPKYRLFLKINQRRYLAAGVYMSEAPVPHPRYTV
jgi:hypothetical protein